MAAFTRVGNWTRGWAKAGVATPSQAAANRMKMRAISLPSEKSIFASIGAAGCGPQGVEYGVHAPPRSGLVCRVARLCRAPRNDGGRGRAGGALRRDQLRRNLER